MSKQNSEQFGSSNSTNDLNSSSNNRNSKFVFSDPDPNLNLESPLVNDFFEGMPTTEKTNLTGNNTIGFRLAISSMLV